jgi:aspartate dehydrogenase
MVTELLKVGLIGCGAIGTSIAEGIRDGRAGEVALSAICDVDDERLRRLKDGMQGDVVSVTSPEDLIALGGIDLIIEAANQGVVEDHAERVLASGKSLMVMSVGALRDEELQGRLERFAKERGVRVYVPSGAICGLDGVKAAAVAGLESVEITTTKHPRSLVGAPYLEEHGIDLDRISEPVTIFRGTASEAARAFPKNVNVAVALSLAGIGVQRTTVRIVADPGATRTQHEVIAKGEFGELKTRVRNVLHPENPRTSYLAVLAAIRTLRKISEPIQVGT